MKIYVAKSWRSQLQELVVKTLKEFGHEVYDSKNPPHGRPGFSWSEIDKNWQQWTTEEYVKALGHQRAIDGFNSDFDGMKWADCCVMTLPCGRSANTEAGWMKGAGKKVYVYSPIRQEPELIYKIYDGITDRIDNLTAMIKEFEDSQNGHINPAKLPDHHIVNMPKLPDSHDPDWKKISNLLALNEDRWILVQIMKDDGKIIFRKK